MSCAYLANLRLRSRSASDNIGTLLGLVIDVAAPAEQYATPVVVALCRFERKSEDLSSQRQSFEVDATCHSPNAARVLVNGARYA